MQQATYGLTLETAHARDLVLSLRAFSKFQTLLRSGDNVVLYEECIDRKLAISCGAT